MIRTQHAPEAVVAGPGRWASVALLAACLAGLARVARLGPAALLLALCAGVDVTIRADVFDHQGAPGRLAAVVSALVTALALIAACELHRTVSLLFVLKTSTAPGTPPPPAANGPLDLVSDRLGTIEDDLQRLAWLRERRLAMHQLDALLADLRPRDGAGRAP